MYAIDVIFMKLFDYQQTRVYEKYFPSDRYISYNEALNNVSLILLNQHFTQDHVRPYVPGMIEVGGLQVKRKPSPLPKVCCKFCQILLSTKITFQNVQEWIDGAEHGVIFFSLGSNAKSIFLPQDKIDVFMKTFSKLKQRVIFKWESDELPEKPDNVLIGNWLPQNDILANRNVKVFVSHCGLGSVVESKYHGVPIVAMPIFADQISNAASVEKEGWGVRVEFATVTEVSLLHAIKNVLENDR